MPEIIKKTDKISIPEGAILISKEKAIEMQSKLIRDWKQTRDVFFLKYGVGFLSATLSISSILIMKHYRQKLNLLNEGKKLILITLVPGVLFPAISLPVFFQQKVTEPIILQGECPVCIQMRSVCLQSLAGIVYPIFVHSAGSLVIANSFLTNRNLPEFSLKNCGKVFMFWKNISQPLFRKLPMHFLLQIASAAFITEMQANDMFKIQAKLASNQEELLS